MKTTVKDIPVTSRKKRKRRIVPRELIYEMVNGSPIYYRDYDKVISGEKTLEEVMGSSLLQSVLITLVLRFLSEELDMKKYILGTNELGLKFAKRSWRNADIAIFEKEKIKSDLFSEEYSKIPPKLVIEIDTKADLGKFRTEIDYFHQKTDDLLNWGVEKVIWIFTKQKKVMVSEKDKNWIISTWDKDIKVLNGIILNVEKLIKDNME